MADDQAGPKHDAIPSVHDVFVRGARTTTSRHDAHYAQLRAEAVERRKAEDARAAMADAKPDEAHRHVVGLGGTREHASIVLELRHPKDKLPLDWIVCELLAMPQADGTPELVLNLCCPRCIQHGVDMQHAQMKIHQSNRMFWLDEKRRGELWVNPADQTEVHTLAGTITMNEWAKCGACSWNFTIENSVVRWR